MPQVLRLSHALESCLFMDNVVSYFENLWLLGTRTFPGQVTTNQAALNFSLNGMVHNPVQEDELSSAYLKLLI
jgi:hypothetical protein